MLLFVLERALRQSALATRVTSRQQEVRRCSDSLADADFPLGYRLVSRSREHDRPQQTRHLCRPQAPALRPREQGECEPRRPETNMTEQNIHK